jgi:hypothetical protein
VQRIAERYKGRALYRELPRHSHWLPGEPRWEMIAGLARLWLDEVLTDAGKSATA